MSKSKINYDEARELLAYKDLDMINDPYWNTVPKSTQNKIEARHFNYIMEVEDDEATKLIVEALMKHKGNFSKVNYM